MAFSAQDNLRNRQITFPETAEGELLEKLVKSKEFDRLSEIGQIAFSRKAYRQGTHCRDIHSLGVYFVADQMLKQIEAKHPVTYDPREALIVRVRALLHDIGHGPFSHTWEGVMKEIGHDISHEDWGERILRDPNSEAGKALKEYSETVYEDVCRSFSKKGETFWDTIVSSQLDADRFDYLLRDTQNAGIKVGINEAYLIPNVQLAYVDVEGEQEICLAFNSKAEVAVEQVLQSREAMYRSISYHKHSESSDALLKHVFKELQAVLRDQGAEQLGFDPNNAIVKMVMAEPGDVSVDDYLRLRDFNLKNFLQELSERTQPELQSVSRYAGLLQKNKPMIAMDLIMDLPGELRNKADLEHVVGIFDRVSAGYQGVFSGHFVTEKPVYSGEKGAFEKIWMVRSNGVTEELPNRTGDLGKFYAGSVFSESAEVIEKFKEAIANDPYIQNKCGAAAFATNIGAVPAPHML